MVKVSIRSIWAELVGRFGTFGAYGLVVFVLARIGDLGMLSCRFLLGRYLPDADFGAIDPFLAVLGLVVMPVGIICTTGMKSLSRLLAQGEKEKSAGLVRDLALITLAGTIVVVVIIAGGQSYIMARLHLTSRVYVALMILLAIFAVWNPLFGTVIQGRQRYVPFALISTTLPPFLLAGLTLLCVGMLGMGFAGALLARVGMGAITLAAMVPWMVPFWKGRRAEYRSELRSAAGALAPVAVFAISTLVLMTFDRLFVRNFLLNDSGGFAAIVTLGQIPLWLVSPLLVVLFPMASADEAVGRDTSRLLRQCIVAGVFFTLLSAAGFAVLANPLFSLWKLEFIPYAGLVWPYAIAMGLHAIICTIATFEIARHRYGGIPYIAAGTLLFCVVLYFVRGWISLEGVVWASVAVRVAILMVIWLAMLTSARRHATAST